MDQEEDAAAGDHQEDSKDLKKSFAFRALCKPLLECRLGETAFVHETISRKWIADLILFSGHVFAASTVHMSA